MVVDGVCEQSREAGAGERVGGGDALARKERAGDDPPAGSSLARMFENVDSDGNGADFIVLGVPTPGHAPLSAIPEPQTAALLGVGLAGLAWSGRVRTAPRTL